MTYFFIYEVKWSSIIHWLEAAMIAKHFDCGVMVSGTIVIRDRFFAAA